MPYAILVVFVEVHGAYMLDQMDYGSRGSSYITYIERWHDWVKDLRAKDQAAILRGSSASVSVPHVTSGQKTGFGPRRPSRTQS